MNEENIQTSTEDTLIVNPSETEKIDNIEANNDIDYKTKFSESSKEALRIRDENIRLKNEMDELRRQPELNGGNYTDNSEQIIPGFDHLSDEEQKNLIAYTDSIKQATLRELNKNPAIANATRQYNESVWNEAFNEVSSQYPDLADFKDEFKANHFNPTSVPTNVKELMTQTAKLYLFDKSEARGIQKGIEMAGRLDIERANGGDKTPQTERTLEDWQQLQISNPVKFAQESAKFNDDMKSGKL